MLRVLLLLLTVVLVWILLFSKFEKRTRILVSIALFVSTIFILWFDSYLSAPRSDKIALSDIEVCDLNVNYSYRTSYDIELCLKNNHPSAVLRRVTFAISAQVCASETECTSVQTQSKSRPLEIPPGEQVTLVDNMMFDQVAALTNARVVQGVAKARGFPSTDDVVNADQIVWSIELLTLRAI